ncbi:MAG: hypothetical protein JWL94_1748 [Microbacteriaceae bacterium]|jgi:hypothetical protein|nr:hypothetical protein [Microbacteriaceae bacterium]HEV7957542.1 hypothetical protein [Marisediminicola sp.]
MSTFRNPVGPQPSSVYWRRRLLVLLGLIAVIVAIVLIVVQPGAGSSSSGTETTSSGATAKAEDDIAAEEPKADPIEGAPCEPGKVIVEAVTDKAGYAPGELPRLSFSITNTSAVSCEYNVGTTQQTFRVSSGDDLYWSSKDCESAPVDALLQLEPNVTVTSDPITWDRTRSAPETCEQERPAAPGGEATFNFTVSVGGADPAEKSFLLY